MKKVKITLVHSIDVDIIVVKENSIYAMPETVYVVPDRESDIEMSSIDIERKKTEKHKTRYENVLKGLNYWKAKANE